jgi:hypothetical protein
VNQQIKVLPSAFYGVNEGSYLGGQRQICLNRKGLSSRSFNLSHYLFRRVLRGPVMHPHIKSGASEF